jgi:uncharacterized membrane protein
MSTGPDVFASIPLFADLTDADRADLRRLFQPRLVEPNRAIVWIGETGDEFFIIEHGHVVISYPDEGGQEVTLAVLGPGHFFGELSLLDGGRRTATARAQTDVRLLVLDRSAFHGFIKKHPASAIHLLTVLGRRQRDSLDKLRGIKNANEVVQERRTPLQRFAERIASLFASEAFLVVNLIFFFGWMIFNAIRYHHAHVNDPAHYPPMSLIDTPPTYFWLGFIVTVEAIILSMFVLNSQKRQAQRDAIKADLDYQVNRKAHLEIIELHEKMDRIEVMLSEAGLRPDDLKARTPGRPAAPPVGGNPTKSQGGPPDGPADGAAGTSVNT